MTALVREGYPSAGMSIFLLFLRRLWIALDANSHAVLKQCVASNRYARKNCENFSKCLRWDIPLERVRSCRKLLCFLLDMGTELCPKIQLCDFACLPVHLANHSACQGRQPRQRCEAAFTSAVWVDMLQMQNSKVCKNRKNPNTTPSPCPTK